MFGLDLIDIEYTYNSNREEVKLEEEKKITREQKQQSKQEKQLQAQQKKFKWEMESNEDVKTVIALINKY